jgi:Holliday junction resolvase RusA-like endonuclease
MEIELRIPAVPVPQPRPRAQLAGNHVHIHEVTSIKKTDGSRRAHPIVAFKSTVRMAFQSAYTGAPLSGPLRCDLVFVFPRPTSLIWKKRPMPRLYHAKKPDRDNLDKSVLDALKGLAWNDDAQVAAGYIEKWIAAGDEQPHVDIRIRTLDIGEFNGEPKYATTGS